MKKIILLLLPVFCFAQNIQFSVSADFRNGIFGSAPTNNNPKADILYQFSMVDNYGIEITIGYELFNNIGFDRYQIQVGHQFQVFDKFKIIPAINYNLIGRWGDAWGNTSSHLAFGGTVGFRYTINENFDIEYTSDLLHRVDLNTMYRGNVIRYSGYFKIIYKINL